jgi:TonB-dependent starch-binding outer membrane protein SusC
MPVIMKKLLLLALLLPLGILFATAQTLQIKGRVMEEGSSDGLANVSVTVVETKKGVSTDATGNFSLTVAGRKSVTLSFSFVGYRSETVTTNGSAPVTVSLKKEQAAAADEVVVIGYGTAKKKDVTGATASMSSKDLEKIPLSSAAEAMTGRLPGVQVTTTDGQPGAEIVIRVRGGGSVTQDNSPLYIVDGFPVSSISDIAPTDIASIDILKDAASSAIYGARGANGVVIITTKSAKGGKTSISLNSFVQARTLPRQLDVLSPYEFALAQYEYARIRSQSDVDNFSKYFGVYDDLELYKNQTGTNWQKKLFGTPVYSQQHNLSVTGGTEKTKMAFSMSNNKDEGLMPGSGYERTYMNFKLNHELYKTVKLDLTSRYTNTTINGAGTAGNAQVRIGDALSTRPVNGLADQIEIDPLAAGATTDDYEQFLKSLVDPITLAAQDYRKDVTKVFNMNAGLSWNIKDNLTYRSEFGVDLRFNNNKRYYGPLTGESKTNGNSLPVGEIRNSRTEAYRWANTLNYLYRKDKHDLNILVGQEINTGKIYTDYNRAENFAVNITPDKMFSNMQLGVMDQSQTFEGPGENLLSVFARAIYQYNRKYIFTLTTRYDGSSKFAPGKQWGAFPAFAGAWRISQEDFMRNVKAVSDLKLRLSYGVSGNNRIPNNLYRVTYSPQTNRPIGFGDVNQNYWGFASGILPNPDIKWETTITRDLGIDFAFWRNRLSGTLDLYYNTTPDLLVQSAIPSQTGFTTQIRNQGQTSNRGVELALTGLLINKKDLSLTANFNIGVNKARIDNLGGPESQVFNSNWAGTDLKTIDDYRLQVGKTIGLMYGYVSDGMYTTDDFDGYDAVQKKYLLKKGVADDGGLIGVIGGDISKAGTVRPGVLKLKDLNGDGVVDASDRTVIGSALPKYQGGFGINGSYKAFDFNAFFNYSVGNDVYNANKIAYSMLYRTTYGNMLDIMNSSNRFKYIDANGNLVTDLQQLAALNANATIWSPFSSGTASPVFQSWAVEDGSFLRLSNVQIGYALPRQLVSKLHMTRLRLYATVTNAFLWTKYTGYDPEVSATRSSSYTQLTPGVDYSAYPKSRSYTLGINVNF